VKRRTQADGQRLLRAMWVLWVRGGHAELNAAMGARVVVTECLCAAFFISVSKPTRLEEDFIAELIRDSWHDHKRRPRPGSHRPILVSSLDDLDDSHVAALWEKLKGGESDDENEE
jgi:hypothetical protein